MTELNLIKLNILNVRVILHVLMTLSCFICRQKICPEGEAEPSSVDYIEPDKEQYFKFPSSSDSSASVQVLH